MSSFVFSTFFLHFFDHNRDVVFLCSAWGGSAIFDLGIEEISQALGDLGHGVGKVVLFADIGFHVVELDGGGVFDGFKFRPST